MLANGKHMHPLFLCLASWFICSKIASSSRRMHAFFWLPAQLDLKSTHTWCTTEFEGGNNELFCNIAHINHYTALFNMCCIFLCCIYFCSIFFTCFVNWHPTVHSLSNKISRHYFPIVRFLFLFPEHNNVKLFNYSFFVWFSFLFFLSLMENQSLHWNESSHFNGAVITLFSLWHLFDYSSFMFLPV